MRGNTRRRCASPIPAGRWIPIDASNFPCGTTRSI